MDTHLMAAPLRDDRIQLTTSWPVPVYKRAAPRCPMERDVWKAAVLTKNLQSNPHNKKISWPDIKHNYRA